MNSENSEGVWPGSSRIHAVGKGSADVPQDYEVHSSIGIFGEHQRVAASHDGQMIYKLESGEGVEFAPKRTVSWQTVAMIQIAEVVGGGVLTMASAFAQLGWVLSVILLLFFLLANVYIGIILSKCREIFPAAVSYEEMTKYAVGKRWVVWGVNFSLWSYLVLTFGGYFLAITQSLQMLLFDVPSCTPLFGAFGLLLMILPLQIRTLHGTTVIVWLNFGFIVISVFVALFYMIGNMSTHHAQATTPITTQVIVEDMTWTNCLNGVSKLMFSYLGSYCYLQMMAEMKTPGEFPKTFVISGPFQFSMYLFVGVVGYLYDGDNAGGMIIAAIDPHTNPALVRISSLFLLFHLMILYMILSVVFCRDLHSKIHIESLDDYGKVGKLVWLLITTCLLLSSYVVSNGLPMFDKVTALIGALQGPILGYFIPPMLLLCARNKVGIKTHPFEKAVLWAIMISSVCMVFLGTAANVESFISAMNAAGATPFQCNLEPLENNWNTLL